MGLRLPLLTAVAAAILCVSGAHGAVTTAIFTRKGRKASRLVVGRPGTGLVASHVPRALRTGKHRLKRDHYVLSMTATAGSESASHSMELTVK